MRRSSTIAAVCAIALAGFPVSSSSTQPEKVEWEEVCRFTDHRLVEISGMAVSVQHPGVIWVHNDSGDRARLYAVDAKTCETVGELRLRGVKARDFEGLASGTDDRGRPALWIGDIGDNRDSWPHVTVYQVREPRKLDRRSLAAKEWRFTYPDRPHNAETLMVQGERVWVATWQLASGGLYSVPLRPGIGIADRVGDVGSLITDGAINPSGTAYVLRDYLDVHLFRGLPPGQRVARLVLPAQVQGEAITWTADGRALFIASEDDPRLLRIEIPWWVRASLRPPDHLTR